MSAVPIIRFEHVVAHYPRAPRPALHDVTIDVPRAAVTAVAGPNGSGKSTLVRLLLRTVPLLRGEVQVNGQPLSLIDRRTLAQRISVVTQREEPVFALSVREYVSLGRYPHEGPWRAESSGDSAAIERAASLTGIGALLDRTTTELSGGEWQRVRIARAVAQGGEALVLDEPNTFLDIAHEMAMFELFSSLSRGGVAILVVSHQLNLAARFADGMVLMHQGTVAAAGTPADVMQAATLERVYEWPLLITRDAAVGALALVPLRGGRQW